MGFLIFFSGCQPSKITLTLPKASFSPSGPGVEDAASIRSLGFVRPLVPGQKQMLRSHLEGFKMNEVGRAADETLQMYEEAKALHSSSICCSEAEQPVIIAAKAQFAHELEKKKITKGTVDAMAATLTDLIFGMNVAALEVLPAMQDPIKRKLFRPRAMNRKYQNFRREQKWLVKKMLNRDKVKSDGGCSQHTSKAANPSQGSNMYSDDQEEAWEEAKSKYKQAGKQMKALQHQQIYRARRVHVKKPKCSKSCMRTESAVTRSSLEETLLPSNSQVCSTNNQLK